MPAFEEPRHVDRDANGRAFLDACRMAKLGSWTGWLEVDGRRIDVTPDHWWGSRDRSWGIRPVGEAEPPGNLAGKPGAGLRWLYAPIRLGDLVVEVEPVLPVHLGVGTGYGFDTDGWKHGAYQGDLVV